MNSLVLLPIQLVSAGLLEKWDSLIKMQLKHWLDNDTIKNKEAILVVFIDYKQTAIRWQFGPNR